MCNTTTEAIELVTSDYATEYERVEAYQFLIDSGIVWQMDSCYSREASALIAAGECVHAHLR